MTSNDLIVADADLRGAPWRAPLIAYFARGSNMEKFVVLTASAHMPNSCWGRYGRIALIELAPEYAELGMRPKMISARARGTARVICVWERLHKGGPRSAYWIAFREATEIAKKLNKKEGESVSL